MTTALVSIVFLLIAALGNLAASGLESAQDNRLEWREAAQSAVSLELARYVRETGTFPASLGVLAAAPGFSHLRTFLGQASGGIFPSPRDAVTVQSAAGLNDGIWTFSRSVVFALKDNTEQNASYLGAARNACAPAAGAREFASTLSWCGPRDNGWWFRYESRQDAGTQMARAREAQVFSLTKLATFFNASGAFPAQTTAALHTFVAVVNGATGSGLAASCSGTFQWNGIPMDCADLYNQFGNPVSYQLVGQRVTLFSNSNYVDNVGSTVVIASELNVI